MAGKWGGNSLESFLSIDIVATASSFLYVYIITKASNDNIFIKKCGGVKGLPMSTRKWRKNGHKLIKSFFGKWRKMVEKLGGNNLESFLLEDIVATASSDNIFIKKSGGRVKGLPMSMCK